MVGRENNSVYIHIRVNYVNLERSWAELSVSDYSCVCGASVEIGESQAIARLTTTRTAVIADGK